MHNVFPFNSGDDLNITMRVVIFPPGSVDGTIHCQNISIVNDGVREEIQNVTLGLSTTDLQVMLAPSSAQIIIIDNDSELTITFYLYAITHLKFLIFSHCPSF